jgi:hypothetical protein
MEVWHTEKDEGRKRDVVVVLRTSVQVAIVSFKEEEHSMSGEDKTKQNDENRLQK